MHLVKQIISASTMDKPHWLVERLSAWAVERSRVESQLWLWLSHFLFEPQFPYLYYRDIQTLFVGIEWKIKCKDMCKPPVWGLAHSWPLINRCWICPSQRALSDTLVVHCASEAVKTLRVQWNLRLTLYTSPFSLPCQPIVCDPCTISTGSSKLVALFVQLCAVCFLRGQDRQGLIPERSFLVSGLHPGWYPFLSDQVLLLKYPPGWICYRCCRCHGNSYGRDFLKLWRENSRGPKSKHNYFYTGLQVHHINVGWCIPGHLGPLNPLLMITSDVIWICWLVERTSIETRPFTRFLLWCNQKLLSIF